MHKFYIFSLKILIIPFTFLSRGGSILLTDIVPEYIFVLSIRRTHQRSFAFIKQQIIRRGYLEFRVQLTSPLSYFDFMKNSI